MFNEIVTGLVIGIALSVFLLLVGLFVVHKFNFSDYVPTLVYCIMSKDTPLWSMVACAMTLSVLGRLGYWGVSEGGSAKVAVLWGIGMWIGTFALYRILWAVSVVGLSVSRWGSVWELTRTKGNVHRSADQKINFSIMVISAVLTTWLAMQGVYN